MSSKPLQAPERAIGCFLTHEDDAIAGWTVGANGAAEARCALVCARPFSPPFHANQPLAR